MEAACFGIYIFLLSRKLCKRKKAYLLYDIDINYVHTIPNHCLSFFVFCNLKFWFTILAKKYCC